MTAVSSAPQTVEFSGVGGLTLIADEWNRGTRRAADRPTILMLHGGGQNRHSWKNTGQVLADDGFHVVALDSRGHGDSDRAPDADYDVDTLTADVMQVLDAIDRPVILIGASMGGLTGILVADQAGPDRVTRLVLVDVVPRFEKNGSARIRDFMFSGLHGFGSLEEAADAVAAYLPHRHKPRSPEGLKKNLRLRDGRWYWHWDPAFMTKPGDDPRAAHREIRAGRRGPDHPGVADPRKALRRGQPGRRAAFPGHRAQRGVRRAVRRRAHGGRRRQRRLQRRGGDIRRAADGGDRVSWPASRRARRTACASPTAPCWRSRRGCARRSGTAARS